MLCVVAKCIGVKLPKDINGIISGMLTGVDRMMLFIALYQNVPQIMRDFVEAGNMKFVKFCHTHQFRWTSDICIVAAENGHTEVLSYLREMGYPWSEDNRSTECLEVATQNNHTNTIIWLIDSGVPFNYRATGTVVFNGNLQVLQHLKTKNKLPYMGNHLGMARDEKMIAWLYSL